MPATQKYNLYLGYLYIAIVPLAVSSKWTANVVIVMFHQLKH